MAFVEPADELVAGEYATITYSYVAEHPIDDTGCLKIAFRYAGDFGTPQFERPTDSDFCSVATDGDCVIEPRWDPKGHTRPWGKALYLKVTRGFLDVGEKIVVVFGDVSQGSPGWRVQTFHEHTFEFKTLVDPIATYQFKELPESPTLRIVAGDPARAVCLTPSVVETGQPFEYGLKLEDRWGNPIAPPSRIRHPGFERTGTRFVEATDEDTGLAATGDPIQVVDALPAIKPYWADFHGQSEETIGSNSIEDYLRFARDSALLDIAGHQGNDFQVTDEFWDKVKRESNRFNEPGSFVVFPGYEWSGNTPLGGDRNVYFGSGEGDISRSCVDLLPKQTSKYPDSPTADVLFETLRKQADNDPFVFAHVGGRYADMSMHDPVIEVAVEIHSAWGTFEWLLDDAFSLGYRVGVCANSDGHKGRPGASYPGASRFGSYGGLTCVLAERLDRSSVLDAMRKRRFYATTGNRSLIDVRMSVSDAAEAMMGAVVETKADSAELSFKIDGTAPVESVDVFNGLELIETIRPYDASELGAVVKVVWSGAEVKGRSRMTSWDGELTLMDNSLSAVCPVNFWNPDKTIERLDDQRLRWSSVTTGGLAGCLVTLARRDVGTIQVKTPQGDLNVDVASLGMEPEVAEFGGLKKRLSVQRLPDNLNERSMCGTLTIDNLGMGDNPIYVRVNLLDGHQAWTSPVYVNRSS